MAGALKDIAFEFASWLSPEFKLYIIKDYQRLKEDESHKNALDWNVRRILTKANYRIHTDAIKYNLLPDNLSTKEQAFVYSDEADLLNVALFGQTASQWRSENKDAKGNIRDNATIEQLLVLSNLENINATLIQQGVPSQERLKRLRATSIDQLKILSDGKSVKDLKKLQK